jgi:hypothetical protein
MEIDEQSSSRKPLPALKGSHEPERSAIIGKSVWGQLQEQAWLTAAQLSGYVQQYRLQNRRCARPCWHESKAIGFGRSVPCRMAYDENGIHRMIRAQGLRDLQREISHPIRLRRRPWHDLQ